MVKMTAMCLALCFLVVTNPVCASAPVTPERCLADHLLTVLLDQRDFEPITVRMQSNELCRAHMNVLTRYPFFDKKFGAFNGLDSREWAPTKEGSSEGFNHKIMMVGLSILYDPSRSVEFANKRQLDFMEALDLVALLEPIWGASNAEPNLILHRAVDDLLTKIFLKELDTRNGLKEFARLCSFLETHDLPEFTKNIRDLERRKKIGKLSFSEGYLVQAQVASSLPSLPNAELDFIEIVGSDDIETFQTTRSDLTQIQWTTLWARFLAATLPEEANPSFFKEPKYCPESFRPEHRFMNLAVHANGRDIQVPMCPLNPVERISLAVHLTKLVEALNEAEEQNGDRYSYFISSENEERHARSGGGAGGEFPWGNDQGRIGEFVHYNGNSQREGQVQTWPVGMKSLLPNGLDISGGVWTWTSTEVGSLVRFLGGSALLGPAGFRLACGFTVGAGYRRNALGARLSRRLK